MSGESGGCGNRETSFPADSSTANYTRYLSVGQVLADLRSFATQTTTARGWRSSTRRSRRLQVAISMGQECAGGAPRD
jgi:hypothetical protein